MTTPSNLLDKEEKFLTISNNHSLKASNTGAFVLIFDLLVFHGISIAAPLNETIILVKEMLGCGFSSNSFNKSYSPVILNY